MKKVVYSTELGKTRPIPERFYERVAEIRETHGPMSIKIEVDEPEVRYGYRYWQDPHHMSVSIGFGTKKGRDFNMRITTSAIPGSEFEYEVKE